MTTTAGWAETDMLAPRVTAKLLARHIAGEEPIEVADPAPAVDAVVEAGPDLEAWAEIAGGFGADELSLSWEEGAVVSPTVGELW